MSFVKGVRRIEVCLAVALASMVFALTGCSPHANAESSAAGGKPVMLSITGYNYTNRHIGSFSVNGQGGGNLFVSTPTSGGGGRACCVLYKPGTQVRKVTVRWEAGACYYRVKSPVPGEVLDELHSFFKEREVLVDPAIPADPEVMEVHFYPDGSIQAAITAGGSLPRLQLDEARAERSPDPRCPNDQKPAEILVTDRGPMQ